MALEGDDDLADRHAEAAHVGAVQQSVLGQQPHPVIEGDAPYLSVNRQIECVFEIEGLAGAFTGGLIGLLCLWLLLEVKKKGEQLSAIKNKINKPIIFFLSLLFIFGLIYEVYYFFAN